MRFIAFWHAAKTGVGPDQKGLAEIYKLFGDMTKAGVLVDKGGWNPSSPSTILRRTGDEVSVTDGPFTESKEVIGGFLILEVASKEAALDWCKRWTKLGGEGFSEIREIAGPPPKQA